MKDILKWVVYGGIFAVPFVVLIVSSSMFFPYITGKNFAFRILVEVALAAWVLLAFYDAQYRPRFSWIMLTGAALLAVMFCADLFGEHAMKSFWSNYERMDGYVTLVHFYIYFLMTATVLKSAALWNRFFNTTLAVAAAVSLYAFAQVFGALNVAQGNAWRVDATLGNSTYMAVYMLFHIAIAALMFARIPSRVWRWVYGILMLIFTFLLLQTGTRGTTVGLVGGAFVAAVYIAFCGAHSKRLRVAAGGAIVALLLCGAGFFAARDSAFVQNSPMLSRIANISLADGSIRFMVWHAAWEGIKEHPVLGWGQENFSYVFNKYYTPELYIAEPWYDRSHNIIMDWLVTGGILGALAYFSILGSALWYLFVRPLVRKEDGSFTVIERGVLIGLLAAYTVHNMFVFDNVVSYIFYAVVLAYIHGRVARPAPSAPKEIDPRVIEQVAAPIIALALVFTVYYVNVPSLRAASDIIDAFQASDPEVTLADFDRALARHSFADQEIREQMMQRMQQVISTPEVAADLKEKAKARVEEEFLKQTEERKGDARTELFLSSFYRANGMTDKAVERLKIARALSPKKQAIIFEQGSAALQQGDTAGALAFFKEAYDLEPRFMDARINYANAALTAKDEALFNELISTEDEKKAYALSDQAVQTVYALKRFPQLIDMFKIRIAERPTATEERTNLAYIYGASGQIDAAIAVLEQAIQDIPSFKTQAEQFITSLEAQKKGIKIPARVR
jgi:O-antigen ligase/tetratricopeptide (TPR) repeat protein